MNEPFGLDRANGVQQAVSCLALAQQEIGQSVAVFSWAGGVHALSGAVTSWSGDSPVTRPPRRMSLGQWVLSHYLDKNVTRSLMAWRPDIVHFHSVHIPRNVALGSHLGLVGIPYCVSVHGGLFDAALRRGAVKKSVFKILAERRYLNDARFIHAVSPHETAAVRDYGARRPIVVVPNALLPGTPMPTAPRDVVYAHHSSLRDRRVFMFVGRLDPWQKGLDVLIEGFAEARLESVALVLVGPDRSGSRDQLTRLADRLGVLSRVVFAGPALGEDLVNLLGTADVFVHPSRWEGLSLSVLTAAAAGRPCLITRQADPLGALEAANAAIIVEPTASSIAAGLRRASAFSREHLETMGVRARRVAEEHIKWPAVAARLVEAYRAAIQPAGDAPHASPFDRHRVG